MRIVFAALAALLPAVMLTSCGTGKPDVTELQLAELVRFAGVYAGERVATTGIVRSHPDPLHYWIEDSALNRVAVYPRVAISSRVGQVVHIVGRSHYSPDNGRSIKADEVKVITD